MSQNDWPELDKVSGPRQEVLREKAAEQRKEERKRKYKRKVSRAATEYAKQVDRRWSGFILHLLEEMGRRWWGPGRSMWDNPIITKRKMHWSNIRSNIPEDQPFISWKVSKDVRTVSTGMGGSYEWREYYKVELFVNITGLEGNSLLKQAEFHVVNAEGSVTCPLEGKALKAALVEAFPAGPAKYKANIVRPEDAMP